MGRDASAPLRGRYALLDHTGDIGIEAEAPDEASLYEVCARALFDVLMGEGCAIGLAGSVELSIEEESRELLLRKWLGELLWLHASEGWVFGSFQVAPSRGGGGGFALTCVAGGERLSGGRRRPEIEIKAVTYHQLSVRLGSDGLWKARVIFDI